MPADTLSMTTEKILDWPGLERQAKLAKAEPTKVRKPGVTALATGVLDLIAHVKGINDLLDSERTSWAQQINTAVATVRERTIALHHAEVRLIHTRAAVRDAPHDLKCASLLKADCSCWKSSLTAVLGEGKDV